MFSAFKILVTCLIISSCTCILIPDGEKTTRKTTLTFGKKVKKELEPFKDDLKKMMDPLISNDVKTELKEKFQGELKKIIERSVKYDQLLIETGRLEAKMIIYRKTLPRIFGVLSRVETLFDDLYPVRRPYDVGVAQAYEEILTSTKKEFETRSCIKVFRQRVSSYGISTADFVDGIRSIYGSFSDKVSHKLEELAPSPPEYNDIASITEMYEEFGIIPDEHKVKTAQIILEPLPL